MVRSSLVVAAALTFLAVLVHRPAWGHRGDADTLQATLDRAGALASVSTDAFDSGETNGFFANLGTNGRTCGTCHVESDAWTFTPRHAQSLAPMTRSSRPTTALTAHPRARRRA